MRKTAIAIVILVLMVYSTPALAQQPVTAATGIDFTASADHSTVSPTGTPILTRYEFRITPSGGACVAVAPVDLAKPTPGAGQTITIRPLPVFATLPANCVYTAVVVSMGPGGENSTPPSGPFVREVLAAPRASGTAPVIK